MIKDAVPSLELYLKVVFVPIVKFNCLFTENIGFNELKQIYIGPVNPLSLKPQVIFDLLGNDTEKKAYDTGVYVQETARSWQNTDSWWEWIKFIAIELSVIPGDVVIIVDSYAPHFADEEARQELATDYGVHLYPLVTNATQFMQPMDAYVIPAWKRHIRSSI